MRSIVSLALFAGAAVAQSSSASAAAQPSCSTTLSNKGYPTPSIVAPYQFRLVATNLTRPRGIIFDNAGNLLVVQQKTNIVGMTLTGNGDCMVAGSPKVIVNNSALNHAIQLSADGNTLYASSDNDAWSWDYSAQNMATSGAPTNLVTNMTNDDHTSRTLLVPKRVNGMLIISRGSTSNVDFNAQFLETGRSQIKAFNISNMTGSPYQYSSESDGLRLGWGLRNSVGVDEEPMTGGIYSVENSVDQLSRDNRDIHEDNPAEEMNFHGYLNGTEYAPQGSNYGYPNCVTAWRPDLLPNNTNITVGTQFKLDDFPTTDQECETQRTPPRLAFAAHMAPLDLKFNSNGTAAWVTFHGSWDRISPIGFKLSAIEFDGSGSPVAASNSSTAAIDIWTNADVSNCPDQCFRPVGMAWDSQGRLFVSSDATGEIYMITRSDGQPTNATIPQAVINRPVTEAPAATDTATSTGGFTTGAATGTAGGAGSASATATGAAASGSGSASGSAAASASSGAAVAYMPGSQAAMGVGLGLGLWNWI